ncbi:protein NO VEIN domain-containing protein [Dyadobacter arcticus]|uniref:Protein NO VEIN C-terminal domain-containing protein n=1 Tax=Dyadobacter arcticus TaxID=1078754 RepID=A0ABX0UHR2_9BACT|nr:DUF3883 domain-containing protein [Dyadobacter arcticus]NIJ52312.1 hypothetical protein [Dyadobacter arcticus]
MIEENNSEISHSRIDTADDYERQSEQNDMRQHANKIIQGIKKLDSNDASRAIWELFQNAVDLSSECHVRITLTDHSFEFRHNGEPFTPMTLDCLFKQVSSKTLEEKKDFYDESDPVGQYGTGFITTHVYGKELRIDGGLAKGEGYVPLEQFVINRSTDNWRELADRISQLKKRVSSLLKTDQLLRPPYPDTSFIYRTSTDHNKELAKKTLTSLRLILPYVMALNPKLSSVTVTDIDGSQTFYEKKNAYSDGSFTVRPISINDIVQEICYIEDENEKIVIILPLTRKFEAFDLDEQLPRLFLYYPLISSQTFGFNFIIHSRQFRPTEPRDGLYLSSDYDSNRDEEAGNRLLIQRASGLIFDFISSKADFINNPIKLATINFNVNSDDLLLNEYFIELKSTWVNQFMTYRLVETKDGNRRPSEILFFHEELLLDENSFDAIFTLAEQFWSNIPKRHLIREWTKKMGDWFFTETTYIRIIDIVNKIQEFENLDFFKEPNDLKCFYTYLIEHGHADLFNTNKLLPNIQGEFRQLSGNGGLNNKLNLPDEFIEIANVIMPHVPKRHVHADFKFTLEFPDYNRKNYSTEINEHIAAVLTEKAISSKIPKEFIEQLINYCKVTMTVDSFSVPSRMLKLICRYYSYSEDILVIPTVKEDDLDLRPPQRRLVRLFLNDISMEGNDWVVENIDFLKDVIATGANYEAYEEMFLTLPVFPNQLRELSEQSRLIVDDNILEEIKNLYDLVIKPNLPIRASLVDGDFSQFLKNKQKRTARDLTERIESAFFTEQTNDSINEHPFKKEILNIIEQTKTSSEIGKLFPLIFSRRSSILVELADGEDSFSILSLDPSRIRKLAELGNSVLFETIIKLGEEAVQKQQQETANFQHKYAIGTHIENVLRERLVSIISSEIRAEIENEQDGQDIIVRVKGNEAYFIEVKSRWDVSTPIRMSKNQTLKADEQRNNYALCFVDMTKYMGDNRYSIQNITEIEHCIRFNKDIGYEVTHLVDVLNQTKEPDTIRLDGDYRTLVPIKFMENGLSITDFEDFLSEFVERIIN